MNPGLYIHVPFCVRKCRYCDFYSEARLEGISAYLSALQKEMARVASEVAFEGELDTLYLGGGTPSILRPSQVEAIVDSAARFFPLAEDLEVTLETNPGTVDKTTLGDFKKAGVTRLNVGVQSLNDETLSFLGRLHTSQEAISVLEMARGVGFENIGADLIFGIPGQSEEEVLADVKGFLELLPEHLSCYMLTLEEGTPLEKAHRKGHFSMLDDALAGALFSAVSNALTQAGYLHYEVSNFARKEAFISRHNVKYWEETTTLGLGPSAHGYWREKGLRWWNFRTLNDYVDALAQGGRPVAGQETLGDEERLTEALYLGLRRRQGVDLAGLGRRFDRDLLKRLKPTAGELVKQGLAELDEARLRLTRRGFALADGIVMRLLRFL